VQIVTVTPALTKNFKSFTLSGEAFRVQGFSNAFTLHLGYSGSHSSQQVKDLFNPVLYWNLGMQRNEVFVFAVECLSTAKKRPVRQNREKLARMSK
jgi:hypothetical protein